MKPEHHGQPMRWRSAIHSWEDEFAITKERYACFACRTEVTVITREHVGPVPNGNEE